MTGRQIPDPADRLTDHVFAKTLEGRYARLDGIDPIGVDMEDFAERYARVCDLVVQLLWAEPYGVSPADPVMHTSAPARQIARLFFLAAGLEPEPGQP
jgi:hypothetical protein